MHSSIHQSHAVFVGSLEVNFLEADFILGTELGTNWERNIPEPEGKPKAITTVIIQRIYFSLISYFLGAEAQLGVLLPPDSAYLAIMDTHVSSVLPLKTNDLRVFL